MTVPLNRGLLAPILLSSALILIGCPSELDSTLHNQDRCETGDLGCECYGNDTCNGDLFCVEGLCASSDEAPDADFPDAYGDDDDTDDQDTNTPEEPLDGACGENAGDHFRDIHDWPGDFCAEGTLEGDPPEMPAPLESTTWVCLGQAGGDSTTCQAARVDACSPERRPPSGWTRITTNCDPDGRANNCTHWGPGGVWTVGFPGGSGNTRRLASGLGSIPQFLAIEIRTFDKLADAYGRIVQESAGPPIPRVPQQIVTISSCPGDFNQEAIMADTGCYGRPSAISSFRWQGPDADPPGAYSSTCVLQPNRTYFWNIIPSNSPLGTAPEDLEIDPVCLEGLRCGVIYSPDLGYPSNADIWSEICDPDVDYSWTTCP